MDRFLRLLTRDQQYSGAQPSRKSKRVAKTLWKIRAHVSSLYNAISSGWEPDCHQKHEVKLRLEDRLSPSMLGDAKARDHTRRRLHEFELIFAGDVPNQRCLWHETSVHVLEQSAPDNVHDPLHSEFHIKLFPKQREDYLSRSMRHFSITTHLSLMHLY